MKTIIRQMKCPHCLKKFNCDFVNGRKYEIFNEIKNAEYTIASLSRKLKIPRTTFHYYIHCLIKEKKIYLKELKNKTGKPKIIKVIGRSNAQNT